MDDSRTQSQAQLPSVLDNSKQQLKKLYFKPSTTEALHSAILLKARNNPISSPPASLPNPPKTSFFSNVINSKPFTPKTIQVNSLLPITPITNQLEPIEQANITTDELDSPLKILKNLKPCLDPLRSSTSDDEESHAENFEKKCQTLRDSNFISSSDIILISTSNSKQTNNTQQKNLYLRKLPPTQINSLSSNTPITLSQSATVLPKAISQQILQNRTGSKRGKEEALSNSSSSDEEDLNNQKNQKQPTLSNLNIKCQSATNVRHSASIKYTNNSNNLLTTTTPPYITPVVSCSISNLSNNNNTLNSLSINSPPNLSYCLEPELINSPSSMSSTSSSFCSSSSPSTNSSSSSASVKSQDYDSKFSNSMMSVASPTSCCSSLTTNDGIIDLHDDNSSTASGPIYVRQPGFEHHAHEVVLEQQIKIQSTTSSPQQGLINQDLNAKLSSLKNFIINSDNTNNKASRIMNKLNKKSDLINLPNPVLKSQSNSMSTGSINVTTSSCSNTSLTSPNNKPSKAKKKLCIMNADLNDSSSNDAISPDKQNILLKPISNKSKREPLPMRLRALPPSFWQQPNQPNVSPGTMYLPPLFKSEIDNISDENNDDQKLNSVDVITNQREREVRISPANTDLLFKLFENIDQNKDKKQVQLLLQSQYKVFKNSNQKHQQQKNLSKALIKGEDPCIFDAVTEGLFPQLKLDTTKNESVHFIGVIKADPNNSAPLLTSNSNNLNNLLTNVNSNNLSNALPILQVEQNYTQALSEVVAAL